MMQSNPQTIDQDQVQIFNVEQGKQQRTTSGRVDLANSANSYIAVFTVPPRGGETHVHHHPDSDQILYILEGECTVQGLDDRYKLMAGEGVLIPAGVNYGFTNEGTQNLVFFSMRSEATGGRRVAYVPNDPSGVIIRVPEEDIGSKGLGRNVYAYAFSRTSLGLAGVMKDEWNKGSLLRMSCNYTREGGFLLVNLPERVVKWYELSGITEGDYDLAPNEEGTMARVDLRKLFRREAGAS